MDIICERCRARVPAEDIDLGSKLAKCRSCQAVFDFSSQLAKPAASWGAAPAASWGAAPVVRARPPVPLPPGLTVVEDETGQSSDGAYRRSPGFGGRLVIRRRWFSFEHVFLLFFCIAWDAFLVFWYSMATGGSAGWNLIAIIFPVAHVAVGVGLTYRTLAGLLNSTWILVVDGALTIKHGPVPWLGGRTLPTDTVKQLFCEQAAGGGRGRSVVSYNLSAMMRDGSKVMLLKSLPAYDQALYLEQRVESALGIEDERVGGEFTG